MLRELHAEWYREHDEAAAGAASAPLPPAQLPRTSTVIARLLSRVLRGVAVCVSGVFTDAWDRDSIAASPIVRNLVAFGGCLVDGVDSTRIITPPPPFSGAGAASAGASAGAGAAAAAAPPAPALPPHVVLQSVGSELSRLTSPVATHLVTTERSWGDAAARAPRSAKVAKALADPQVRLVPLRWLQECLRRFQRLPEGEALEGGGGGAAEGGGGGGFTLALASRAQEARVGDLLALLGVLWKEAEARRVEQGMRQEAARAREAEEAAEALEGEEGEGEGEQQRGGAGRGGGGGGGEASEEEEEMREQLVQERTGQGRKRHREYEEGGEDSDDSGDSLLRALQGDE